MTYDEIGFNDFLLRPLEASYTEQAGVDSSTSYEQISGSQIKGDSINSANGNMRFSLQDNQFVVTDGIVNRVELGNLTDGTIGLIIRDNQGNELIHISGDINIIQSANKHMQLDFNAEQLIVSDEGSIPIVLIGKLS